MDNIPNVGGFMPRKEDFLRVRFIGGLIAAVVAIAIVILYHPATLVAQMVGAFAILVLLALAVKWLGWKMVRFIGSVLSLVVVGMLIAISLGNMPALR